jgi:hypothetical protein
VVLAPKLTRKEILSAIKELRVYDSEDKDLQINFTVNDAVLGSRIVAITPGTKTRVNVSVKDQDDPDSKYEVILYYDNTPGGQKAKRIEVKNVDNNGQITFSHKPPNGKGYYYIQVTGLVGTNKGYHAWTAPVWLE